MPDVLASNGYVEVVRSVDTYIRDVNDHNKEQLLYKREDYRVLSATFSRCGAKLYVVAAWNLLGIGDPLYLCGKFCEDSSDVESWLNTNGLFSLELRMKADRFTKAHLAWKGPQLQLLIRDIGNMVERFDLLIGDIDDQRNGVSVIPQPLPLVPKVVPTEASSFPFNEDFIDCSSGRFYSVREVNDEIILHMYNFVTSKRKRYTVIDIDSLPEGSRTLRNIEPSPDGSFVILQFDAGEILIVVDLSLEEQAAAVVWPQLSDTQQLQLINAVPDKGMSTFNNVIYPEEASSRKWLTSEIQRIPSGDIFTLPREKIIFNSPFDEEITCRFRVTNTSGRRIGWRLRTESKLPGLHAEPENGVLDAQESAAIIITREAIDDCLWAVKADSILVEWINAPNEQCAEFDEMWMSGEDAAVRRKHIPIEYNW